MRKEAKDGERDEEGVRREDLIRCRGGHKREEKDLIRRKGRERKRSKPMIKT